MLSENEKKIFKRIGLEHLFGQDPSFIYRMAVEYAFRKNMQGPHIEALRRGYTAIVECKLYRKTPEFEQEIQFDE